MRAGQRIAKGDRLRDAPLEPVERTGLTGGLGERAAVQYRQLFAGLFNCGQVCARLCPARCGIGLKQLAQLPLFQRRERPEPGLGRAPFRIHPLQRKAFQIVLTVNRTEPAPRTLQGLKRVFEAGRPGR